jgi:beta-phosphoglucomutase-like phosphatase (HAD superfamily)
MEIKMIKAIAFDLDGVLINMVEPHYQSLNKALKEICNYEINREEQDNYYNGISTKAKLNILENRGILNSKDKDIVWNKKQNYTIEIIKKFPIDNVKINMCSKLKLSGYKIACVSNSIQMTLDLMLKQIGIINYFDLILGNENFGEQIKPSPFPYRLCMSKLELFPNEVLIVEDSPKGIMSAKRSGAFVWEVKNQDEVTLENITTKLIELEPWLLNMTYMETK